ncbi:MAG: hypothetical protein ACHQDY_02215 [Solirubrobacterales bacterium]
MDSAPVPMVVQYLYVHQQGEAFYYPQVRADSSVEGVAVRYLECALTQAATLRLRDVSCELCFATNIHDRDALGRAGAELMNQLEALGVRILPTEYRHRPSEDTRNYVSSRYVLDAILSAAAGQPPERQLWLTDLDCVWVDPQLAFANGPAPSEIGCVYIGYGPDWDTVGFGTDGLTRRAIGELAMNLEGRAGGAGDANPEGGAGRAGDANGAEGNDSGEPPPWVGGELLCGTASALCELVGACEELDAALAAEGKTLPTEEQVLTLAGATGRAHFRELSEVARRVGTGARDRAAKVEDPLSLGLWHLPSEKGLSLRRTAREVRSGRLRRLRRDLAEPARLARRFNVAGTGPTRRIQDDGWIALQKLSGAVRSARTRIQPGAK